MTDAKDAPKKASAKKPAAPKTPAKPAPKPVVKKPAPKKPTATEPTPVTPPPFPNLGRADGPWSFHSAPSTQAFVSFGPLKVPAFPTLHVRIEIDPKTRRAGAVSILVDDCSVQLQVMAAPRHGGLWSDIRRAITARVLSVGGQAQAVEGNFGTELIINLPLNLPGGHVGMYTQRTVGIDGESWMIRAVVAGASVLDDATVAKVDALLSRCAVERGDDPIVSGKVMTLSFAEGQGSAVSITEVGVEVGAEAHHGANDGKDA